MEHDSNLAMVTLQTCSKIDFIWRILKRPETGIACAQQGHMIKAGQYQQR